MKERLCDCGSGKERESQYDGYGIFLCYTCEDCHEDAMKKWRHDIMERYDCDEPLEPGDY